MKKLCATLLSASIFSSLLVASSASAATIFFDPLGTSGALSGSYSWDGTTWSTVSGTSSSQTTYVNGDFPEFTSASTYTVIAGADEQMAGMFQNVSGGNLTINATGVGTLDITSGVQGILNHSGSTLTINAPISGVGGIEPENGGTIALNGVNTYTGGTLLASSSTLVDYNNNSAFSTGTITVQEASTSFAPLLSTGSSTITLANNWSMAQTGGVNFASGTPVVLTGNISLGTFTLNLRNNGTTANTLTHTGVISGSGGLTVSGANSGIITLSGANTYTGVTTIGQSGDTAVTLRLGAANTIASSSGVVMAGGKLDLGGFSHSMGSTTLTLSVSSSMDFSTAGSSAAFANSSGTTWTGELNLLNYSSDELRFGTDDTGLTEGQLNDIAFNGVEGGAYLDNNGFLVVPEPSSILLGTIGGLGLLVFGMIRRRRMA